MKKIAILLLLLSTPLFAREWTVMEVVAHQGMVEACPQHFVIADKPLHEKNLKTVKAMPHLQSGPYEYKASIARIKKGFKDQPNSCDTEYQSFKKKNNPYFVYRR